MLQFDLYRSSVSGLCLLQRLWYALCGVDAAHCFDAIAIGFEDLPVFDFVLIGGFFVYLIGGNGEHDVGTSRFCSTCDCGTHHWHAEA